MKKVTLELLVDENGDEDINPIKGDICDRLERCYHNIKLVSYEEESIDARWFCAKDLASIYYITPSAISQKKARMKREKFGVEDDNLSLDDLLNAF